MTGGGAGPLAGQVVLVTGGGGGIGGRTCVALHREGARLVVADRDRDRVDTVLREIEASAGAPGADSLMGLAVDVREPADVEAMVARVLDRFGRIDILVHCAGILRGKGGSPRPLAQVSTEEWDEVLGVNLKGTFLCNRAVLPAMIAQRGGQIVNLSSTSGRQGRAFDGPYCASKFGVVGLSESLAEEVRQFGIKVHVVMPDAVATPLWEQNGPVPAPEHALAAERVADVIRYVVALPRDTILANLIVAPFRSRRRREGRRREVPPADSPSPVEGGDGGT